MRAVHIFGDDIDRLFQCWGEFDAWPPLHVFRCLDDIVIVGWHVFSIYYRIIVGIQYQKLLMSQFNQSTEDPFLHQNKRKLIIQSALLRLKKKNEDFLDHLESNSKWRKIYNGLLFHNSQAELSKLISLQLCEATENGESSFFNPFEKIPISMCYNKINKLDDFEQQALYNLVLLYDSKTRKDMNWNKIDETAKSTVRALNISNICKRNDKQCFETELKNRVLEKERFKGHTINFQEVYQSGIEDMTPISQILHS